MRACPMRSIRPSRFDDGDLGDHALLADQMRQ